MRPARFRALKRAVSVQTLQRLIMPGTRRAMDNSGKPFTYRCRPVITQPASTRAAIDAVLEIARHSENAVVHRVLHGWRYGESKQFSLPYDRK